MSTNPHALKVRELPMITLREAVVVAASMLALIIAAARIAASRFLILRKAYLKRQYGPFLETTKELETLSASK
jgi:hypothetical protein